MSTGGLVQANLVSRGFNNVFSGQMLMLQDYRFAGVPSLRVNVPFLFTGSNEDIDRIEILQGPAAALYGPNSGNGVLHIITKSPFESRGTTFTATGGNRAGSGPKGIGRFSGRHAGVFGSGRFGYKLSGEVFRGNEFRYFDPEEPAVFASADLRIPASRAGQPVQRDFKLGKETGEARLDYRLSEDTELISTVGFSRIASAIELTTFFGAAQARNWTYMNFQERFRHKNFFAQIFYNQSDAGNANALDDAGTFFLQSGIPIVDRSSILVGQVQQAYDMGRTRLVAGGEYIATRPRTEGTINGRNDADDDINEYGGYLQSTTALMPRLDLLAALRFDVNSRIEGAQLSPRAALTFKASQNQNVRLTFNRALNTPASYAFFLDQWSGRTPAPGMDLQVMGTPPKVGWSFQRDCAGGADGGLCMRSPYAPGMVVPAAATAAYPGMILALPAIVQGLPEDRISAANRALLLGALQQFAPLLNSLRPTPEQVGTVLMDLNPPATPVTSVSNTGPLGATFTNTWELGYKGLLGSRTRLSVDYWLQRRPYESAQRIVNPGVMFDGPQLAAYLGANIAQALIAQGASPQVAQATAEQVAPAITQVMAAIPVGTTALASSLYDKPYLVYTYIPQSGFAWVNGVDVAADYALSSRWALAGGYSHLSRNVFPVGRDTLSANTPRHRATATLRYEKEDSYSAELRGRYADAFSVRSGVYVTSDLDPTKPYDRVPPSTVLDATASWMLRQYGAPRISLTVNNLLNSRSTTFIGVPSIGRVILTQLQYTF
jgi:iron complex outermembrane receptor protein